MSKTAKTNVILIIATVIVAFFAIFFAIRSDNLLMSKSDKSVVNTPTLFVHGLGGSMKSTDHLATIASRDGGQRSLVIYVDKDGNIQHKGKIKSSARKPIIQVIFQRKFTSVNKQVSWFREILQILRAQYGFTTYNVVGHSTGAVTALDTAAKYNSDSDMPKLQKFVSIAGPYDGIMKLSNNGIDNYVNSKGQPSIYSEENKWFPSYQTLINDCKNFPKNVSVLNIYGDDNKKTDSDGVVSVASAKSLKYLVAHRVKNYDEIPVTGNSGQHSRLHHNIFVDHIIARFLFDEN
ncbi:MAG: alpha/beta hydrolase [Apilactobacillus sp.]|uniref:alpha/beta hydrolase n=1 Tax=Apilactobacillus sp. TaxID=2767901 RepID=UPI0025FD763B|nr:alpha/beta hydrolase [Apilactobacillus sp.]MCT6822682.1 alpha/beta hydrolase [Apilactobacillus sp.]MCT6858857.1 alpha/beta hydrolase [Apilactobacillus sp.]